VPPSDNEALQTAYGSVFRSVNQLIGVMVFVEDGADELIPFKAIQDLSAEAINHIHDYIAVRRDVAEVLKAEQETPDSMPYARDESEQYRLRSVIREILGIEDVLEGTYVAAANSQALLVTGEAGTGKTHLLCDVARRRTEVQMPSILLAGGHFDSTDEPWARMIQLLQLSCRSGEEFLGALQAAGEASGCRTLLLIDAMNEGGGISLWRSRIAGLLTMISRYPSVSIAISVRSSYEPAIIPDGLVPDRLVRVPHYGFSDHEYEAARTFFAHYGIEMPRVPVLAPEFQNPLFLKTLCIALQNKGLTAMPKGLEGITAILEFFLASINEKVAGAEGMGYGVGVRNIPPIIQQATDRLAKRMAEHGVEWLSNEEARLVVAEMRAPGDDGQVLFRSLLSEGVLGEDIFTQDAGEWFEGVRFAFQRFTHHLIAKNLLDSHLDIDDPESSFEIDRPLGSLLRNQREAWRHRGVVDAFAVQLPERINRELPDIATRCRAWGVIHKAFMQSLVWRDPATIQGPALAFINDEITKNRGAHDELFEVLLTVAPNPEHPFNAQFLHDNLLGRQLPDRDSSWTIWLHDQLGTHGGVDRYIDWATGGQDKSRIEQEPIRLCGIVIGWFLASSNRFLRDRATKALVSLFLDHMPALRAVLAAFRGVDDPYITERLLAVAYGCALKSRDSGQIVALARDVYDLVFANDAPPVDILIRDYARGVVEVAVRVAHDAEFEMGNVRPPYRSEWPDSIATREQLGVPQSWRDASESEMGYLHLYDSVFEHGDFARYVIGTNWGRANWTSNRLGAPRELSGREMFDQFVDSLTDRQQRAWNRFTILRDNLHLRGMMDEERSEELFGEGVSQENLSTAVRDAEALLRQRLGKHKSQKFDEIVLPYLSHPDDDSRFDISLAQRFILQRVLDLGWSVEKFGQFDRTLGLLEGGSRTAHKAERIGKKYQWIAYHEFLARLVDNFEIRTNAWDGMPATYSGPWQLDARDIDPSSCLKATKGNVEHHKDCWWSVSVDDWGLDNDAHAWLQRTDDVPAPGSLILREYDRDGSRWLVLDSRYVWEEPTPADEERFERSRRQIYCSISSYLIREQEAQAIFDWLVSTEYRNDSMGAHMYDVFLGEFPWAQAFLDQDNPYHGRPGWIQPVETMPGELTFTADEYITEDSGYDCSVNGRVEIRLPSKWLVDSMGLRWNRIGSGYEDPSGRVVAFDPSVNEIGPKALLVERDHLKTYLHQSGQAIVWIVAGEKRVLGGRFPPEPSIGRLEVAGWYRLLDDNLVGELRTNLVEW